MIKDTMTITMDDATTIKNMLAVAVMECPGSMIKEFEEARRGFIKAMVEGEEDA